jgi:hypothetical protein
VLDHGTGIFDSIVTKQMAQALKDYAGEVNQELTPLFVNAKDHQYHVQLPHAEHHGCVQDLLKQVASHPVLDSLLSPSSSLMSLSIVLSEYGATDQSFHCA